MKQGLVCGVHLLIFFSLWFVHLLSAVHVFISSVLAEKGS